MDNPLRTRKAEWLVTMPSFLWLMVFFAIPSVIVLAFTFHGHDALGGVGGWSMETWREIVDPDYSVIVWKTLRISFEVTLLSVLLAIPCAYAIARMNSRWRGVIAGAIMLPFWTSFVVRVFAWKTMLHPNGWLQACLPTSSPILDSEAAVVLVSVYTFLPFAIMPIYTAAEKFDFGLLEAARDLGARNSYAFRKIFLPGIRQGVLSAVLMVFVPAVGSYVIPQMLGGANCVLIGNKIFMRTIQNRNIPHASALATLMAVSVLVPIMLAMWWRNRRDAKDRRRLEAQTAKLILSGMGR